MRYRTVEGDWRVGDVCMVRVCWSRPNVVFMMHKFYVTGWVCCLYCLSVMSSVSVFQVPKWFGKVVERNMDIVSTHDAEHMSVVCEDVEEVVWESLWREVAVPSICRSYEWVR